MSLFKKFPSLVYGLNRSIKILKLNGFKILLYRAILLFIGDFITRYRVEISEKLYESSGGVILYGPFQGLKLSSGAIWGKADLGSIILGFYEKEVLERVLCYECSDYNTFIDIGAADGLYLAGLAFRKGFSSYIGFESNDRSRLNILENLKLNNIDFDNIQIFGEANSTCLANVSLKLENCVVLVDIEGGEYNLLSEEFLRAFTNCIFIIELHPFLVQDGAFREIKLLERLGASHILDFILKGDRNPNIQKELKEYSDNERWLLCSEGRGEVMRWVVASPRDLIGG